MSFSEVLKEAVDRVDGALSAAIVGIDGMTVAEYTARELINLDELSAEIAQMIKDVQAASGNVGLGEAVEFSIITDMCGIMMRKITDEYFMALILEPGGNLGKGRFVLKSLIPRIRSEF